MSKKILITVLAALLLLTACGNGNSGQNPTNSPTDQTTPTGAEDITNSNITPTTEAATSTPEPATPTPTEVPAAKVSLDNFVYIDNAVNGAESVVVDVTALAYYAEGMSYQVSVLSTDGSIAEYDCREEGGKVTITGSNMAAVEVSPILNFIFGKRDELPAGSINVLARTNLEDTALYGFVGSTDSVTGGVHLKGIDVYFETAAPSGFYNITVTKAGTARSLVCVNGQALGCNVGIPGSGDRKGYEPPYNYYMEDVNIEDDSIRISLGEKDMDIAALEIRRANSFAERRVHLYLGGDSICAAYYPLEIEVPAAGRFQTGWGQVLCNYINAGTAITNLGSGGTCTKGWYDIAFEGVMQNAQEGDIFIIMHGINDQSYSNVEEMTECLNTIVDRCREKGVIPVLCTPIQSAKFWKNENGKDVGEYGVPVGSGKYPYMQAIRKVAADKGTFLIDISAITGEMYGTLGKTFVTQNFHIYNSLTGKEEDTLHLSYMGASNVAGIVATELYRLQEAGTTDSQGKCITGVTFNELGTYELNYTDKDGNAAVFSEERITPVYRKYAERAVLATE